MANPAELSLPVDSGVLVAAAGRLHLGFLDPAATLGRRFGSLGLVVDGVETAVELRRAATDGDSALDAAGQAELPRARAHLLAVSRLLQSRGVAVPPMQMVLRRVLPTHAGLGSGTQLALAVGRAVCELTGARLAASELAAITGRGLRSGVGIAGFERGGLLLDGGPTADGHAAIVLSRIELPAHWRVLLALDPRCRGLSGEQEKAALATLPSLPRESAAEICHEVLMRILPGAAGDEFMPFAAGLTRMQRLLGQHFAPAQNGSAFSSRPVGRLIDWISAQTPAATGQSSWGPTGFAILPSAEAAEAALRAAGAAGVIDPALQLLTVGARRDGARVRPLGASVR